MVSPKKMILVWCGMLAAGVLLMAGPRAAEQMLERGPTEAWYRGVAIFFGTASVVPLLVGFGWTITLADEYERARFMRALAVAFASSLLWMAALDLLGRAAISERWWPGDLWPGLFVIAWVCLVGSWLFGSRRP
jgi:hypothetical protein